MRNPPIHTPIPARQFLLAVLVIFGISGCGGGSGGSPANQAPVASSSCAYASGVNQQFNGSLTATDPEGQPLSYSLFTNVTKGSVSINPFTGAFTYTPNMNTRGSDSFTFQACEPSPSTLCSNVATYTIVHTPRIMPLGDSITDGATNGGPPVPDRVGYRKPLKESLTAASYVTDFVGTQNSGGNQFSDSQHEGWGGFTADQVNANLTNWFNDPAGKPDFVLLHIGTNDISVSGGFNMNDVNDVQNILNTIDSWEASNWPVTVLVSRIITNRQFATSVTTQFNNAVIAMVQARATDLLEWVDHQSVVLDPGDFADLLHPTTGGYQKMSDVWLYPLTGSGTVTGNHSGPGLLPKCP